MKILFLILILGVSLNCFAENSSVEEAMEVLGELRISIDFNCENLRKYKERHDEKGIEAMPVKESKSADEYNVLAYDELMFIAVQNLEMQIAMLEEYIPNYLELLNIPADEAEELSKQASACLEEYVEQ